MMRRAFMGFACAGFLPLAVAAVSRAQSPAMPLVGFLGITTPSADFLSAFREGLAQHGHIEARIVRIIFRSAEGVYDRLPALAVELAASGAEVVVAVGGPAALAARQASATIPIVFLGGDPIKSGLVASFNRAGGNATGIFTNRAELTPKRLQLLHELVAGARSVAYLSNPANPTTGFQFSETQAVARSRNLDLALIEAGNPDALDRAFARMAEQRVDALMVMDDPLYTVQCGQIIAMAARHAIPAIYSNRESAARGGLIAYGPSNQDIAGMPGVYAAKILGGARPADLPVERPSRFELVINLKTALALGLTVPPSLLALPDEVIE
jgi:putative ABC transport system substrate-binding protein